MTQSDFQRKGSGVQPFRGRLTRDSLPHHIRIHETTGCWLWIRCRTPLGYGQKRVNGKALMAHRLVYELIKGPIPAGAVLLHKCDNPPCCNPDHLAPGTQADNIHDCIQKGRFVLPAPRLGSANNKTKLNPEAVRKIRALRSQGVHFRVIAKEFGVAHNSIVNITTGKAWAHVL